MVVLFFQGYNTITGSYQPMPTCDYKALDPLIPFTNRVFGLPHRLNTLTQLVTFFTDSQISACTDLVSSCLNNQHPQHQKIPRTN